MSDPSKDKEVVDRLGRGEEEEASHSKSEGSLLTQDRFQEQLKQLHSTQDEYKKSYSPEIGGEEVRQQEQHRGGQEEGAEEGEEDRVSEGDSDDVAEEEVGKVDCGERPKNPYIFLECAFCFHRSRTRYDMKRHMENIHLGLRRFKCEYCGVDYQERSQLKRHVAVVHMGERPGAMGGRKDGSPWPWKCDICGKELSMERHLREHINRVHLGKKDFGCHLCDHRASSAGQIRRHVKTVHLQERPFSCVHNGCTFSASNRHALKLHMDSVHLKKREVPCPHCNYMSATVAIMNGHIKRRHGGVGLLKGRTGGNFVGGGDGGLDGVEEGQQSDSNIASPV